MKHLEKAFRLLIKNYLILIPMFVAIALPALIQRAGATSILSYVGRYFLNQMNYGGSFVRDPMDLVRVLTSFFAMSAGSGFIALVLKLAAQPATAGMVLKALRTEVSTLDDFVPSLKQYWITYLLYWVGTLVVGLIVGLAGLIILIIFATLIPFLKVVGIFLFVLVLIAVGLAGFVVNILLSMWFPAMVIDSLPVIDALKQSLQVVKGYFWPLVGLTLLVTIGGGIVSGILGFLGMIPVLGSILLSVIPTFTSVLLTTFYFSVYHERTGKGSEVL